MNNQTEKILFQLELDVNALVGNTAKAKEVLSGLKIEGVALNKALDDLKKTGVTSGASFDNLNKQLIANKAAQQNATTEIRSYEKQLRLAVAANDAQIGSIDQMKARLSILTAEWNALSLAGRENTAEGKTLAESIDLTTQELNKQEQSVGNFHRQVGDYKVATISLREEIKLAKDEATRLTREYGENSKEAETATRKVAALVEQQDDFNKRVAAFNPEAKFAAFTQVAGSLAGGLSAAAGAMALVGSESDLTQQAMVKLQAIMAISTGLNQISALADGFKNLKLVLGITTVAKQVDTAATGANAAANVAAAGASEVFAAGQVSAAGAAGGLKIALNSLLGPIGLIVVAVGIAVAAFSQLGKDQADEIQQITDAIQGENEAHKATVEALKLKNDAQVAAAENALAIAQSEKKSAEEIGQLQKDVIEAKKAGLQKELIENKIHFDELLLQQQLANAKLRENLSEDEQKKAQEQADIADKELQANKNRSDEIVIQGKKLNNDLIVLDNDLAEKRAVIHEQTATARIGLIKNERDKEIAAEVESNSEKLRQLLKAEEENAELISATKAESAQKIRDINFKFDTQELQERNKLAILLTREGSDQRLAAELQAATTERDQQLKNDKLTATQREIIIAESNQKIFAIKENNLKFLQDKAQQEIDIENQKQSALIAIQKASATTPGETFAADIAVISTSSQQQIAALDKAKSDRIALIRLEIEEKVKTIQEGENEIANIEETADAQKLQAQIESNQAVLAEIQRFNEEQLQNIVDQRELELQAADISEQLDAKIALLDAELEVEKQHAKDTIHVAEERARAIELIEKKHAKAKALLQKEGQNQIINSMGDFFGASASFYKQDSQNYKALASAQAIISTYLAANKALASLPPPASFIAAGATIISGLANVAQINKASFYKGGFTGEGDPRSVSTTLGPKPYEYHKEEYVIDHKTLRDPVVGGLVKNIIEPMRTKNGVPYSSLPGHFTGGLADASQVINSINVSGADPGAMKQAFKEAISEMPTPVVLVDDINESQATKVKVESRANVFGK